MDLLIIFAALFLLILYLTLPGRPARQQNEPFQYRYFAHRGLYQNGGPAPENSLPAFAAAARAGYGVELDVQLSRDGQVVVFHDDTLDRVCGVQGRVDAFTLEELQAMPLLNSSEVMPLFSQVLEVLDGVPVIVELKSGPRNPELCQKTLELLRAARGPYCVESFDPTVVAWFRRHAPRILRGQLTGSAASFPRLSRPRAWLLSRCMGNFLARPQFIAWGAGRKNWVVKLVECMGPARVHWTAHETDDQNALQLEYDSIIFEGYEPPVRW